MKDNSPSRLFVLVGPSGVGKSTILRHFESRFAAESSPKYTTRPSRNTEEDARDFIHCVPPDFPKDGVLAFESYGHLFGIQLNAIAESFRKDRHHVTIVGSNDTAAKLLTIFGNRVVVIFVFCDFSVLKERIMVSADVHRSGRWAAISDEIDHIYQELECVDFVINNSKSFEATFNQIETIVYRVTCVP